MMRKRLDCEEENTHRNDWGLLRRPKMNVSFLDAMMVLGVLLSRERVERGSRQAGKGQAEGSL